MLTAFNRNKETVISYEASKEEKPFFCLDCHSNVILKSGKKRISHFSHLPGYYCAINSGETIRHLTIKKEIYEGLKSKGFDVHLEYKIGNRRSDVYLTKDNKKYVIEIQKSNISIEEIQRRIIDYCNYDCRIVWIMAPVVSNINEGDEVKLKAWELYLMKLYGNHLFYHNYKSVVTCIGFEDTERYVEQTEWGGGYWKKLKTIKTVKDIYEHLAIDEYFRTDTRFYPIYKHSWQYNKCKKDLQ